MMDHSLVRVENLSKHFPIRHSLFAPSDDYVKAVDGISLEISDGSSLGAVGESGSGKSTLGYLLVRLLKPTSGRIYFQGKDISSLQAGGLRTMRHQMQIVFQDPDSSLNPRRTVEQSIIEPLVVQRICPPEEMRERVFEMLERVGLDKYHLSRHPHELSGGQRQRVAIARALITYPRFLVFDEPTSALDVSVQAMILELIQQVKEDFGLTYLFISHDLSVIRFMCADIAVMYMGQVIEQSPTERLYVNPLHPYTQALLASIPRPDPLDRSIVSEDVIIAEPPSQLHYPPGCRFHPRCSNLMDRCLIVEPKLEQVEERHHVACHLYD